MTEKALVGVFGSGILGAALLSRIGGKAVGASLSGRNGARRLDLSKKDEVEAFFAKEKISAVVNAAANSDVDGCERDPALAWAANAEAVKNLAAACSKRGLPFAHVSTNYVFGGSKVSPYAESDPTGPVNVYGLTKLAGEHFALGSAAPVAVVRTSWLFGDGNPKNFVTAVERRLRTEKTVAVLDDQTDAATYAEDLVDALFAVLGELESAKPGFKEIYQVCNSGTTTRLEMARCIKTAIGSNAEVTRLDPLKLEGRLAVRPKFGAMSPAKFEKRFGRRMRPWNEALAEYVARKGA